MLLDQFDRLCDAPNAIVRLRRFVIDLAVRGMLGTQELPELPVSLAAPVRNVVKSELSLLAVEREGATIHFSVPKNWALRKLSDVSRRIHYGFTASAIHGANGVRLLRITDIQNNSVDWPSVPSCDISERELSTYQLEENDVLIARTGGTIGKSFLVQQISTKAVFASYLIRVKPSEEIAGAYLKTFLDSTLYWQQLADGTRGTGQPNVNGQTLGNLVVPIPPLAEQWRIVAKVNELLALCDRLEGAQAEREARREQVGASSIASLSKPTEIDAILVSDWEFHLRQLEQLYSQPHSITSLRRTILELAVRGRLTRQHPADEPVRVLLAKIDGEQRNLRSKRMADNAVATSPAFELPHTWRWISLQQILAFGPQNGLSPKPTNRLTAPKAITLTATTSGRFDGSFFKRVDANITEDSDFWLQPGDLLFQRGNTRDYVGMAAIYDGPPQTFIYPDLIIKVRVSGHVDIRYVHLASIAPYARTYLTSEATGAQSTMPKINQATLLRLPIPLPPLAEQRRIVAKVDELMSLCDQLEAGLTLARTQKRLLLESLLQGALEGKAG